MKSISIINCDFSNNGGDGIRLGKNSNVEFINTKTNNNGRNGVTLGSGAEAMFDRHEARDNRGCGIEIDEDIVEKLGLPTEVDTNKLKSLIEEVYNSNDEQKEAVVRSSFLSDFLANTSNASTIIANIIQLADKLPSIF